MILFFGTWYYSELFCKRKIYTHLQMWNFYTVFCKACHLYLRQYHMVRFLQMVLTLLYRVSLTPICRLFLRHRLFLLLSELKSPRDCKVMWSWNSESNREPTLYESVALPVELFQHWSASRLDCHTPPATTLRRYAAPIPSGHTGLDASRQAQFSAGIVILCEVSR